MESSGTHAHGYLTNILSIIQDKFAQIFKKASTRSKMGGISPLQQIQQYCKNHLGRFLNNERREAGNVFDKTFLATDSVKILGMFNSAPVKIADTKNANTTTQFVALDQRKAKHLNVKCYLHSILAVIQLLQCVRISNHTNKELSEGILGGITFIAHYTSNFYLHISRRKGPICASYLNNIFAFNKKLGRNQTQKLSFLSLTEILCLLFVPIALVTAGGIGPFFVFGFHLSNPCKPSLVGYQLLEECQFDIVNGYSLFKKLRGYIMKCAIFILNTWMLTFGISGIQFQMIQIHIISVLTFRENIQLFWKLIRESCSAVFTNIKMYRQLQLFQILLNEVQKTCLGVVMVTSILGTCASLVLIVNVSSNSDEGSNVFMTATLGLLVIDGTYILLVLLGGMVLTYSESNKTLERIRGLDVSNFNRKERSWFRMYWKSCTIIRIKFGDNNFVEDRTPLNCLDCVLDLTMEILIVMK